MLIISSYATHVDECVIIAKMHQVKCNIGMDGDFQV